MKLTTLLLIAGLSINDARDDHPEPMLSIEKTALASIHLEGFPDWLEIGFGSLWVSNPGLGAVQRIDL